ncbi:unnamed protein product [Owenia fusiformis]|uniref:Uncharacterized protein n=1 Tax=Owenia fusiformis TaxID=6347 RepID=A0A8J1V030_OWEFU|nr:unnamed protein product [Owenia fusiformis]
MTSVSISSHIATLFALVFCLLGVTQFGITYGEAVDVTNNCFKAPEREIEYSESSISDNCENVLICIGDMSKTYSEVTVSADISNYQTSLCIFLTRFKFGVKQTVNIKMLANITESTVVYDDCIIDTFAPSIKYAPGFYARRHTVVVNNTVIRKSLSSDGFSGLADAKLEKLRIGASNNVSFDDIRFNSNSAPLEWFSIETSASEFASNMQLPLTKRLGLGFNSMTSLQDGAISNQPEVMYLYLDNNNLTTLTNNVFKDSNKETKLDVIYLNENQISNIENDAFKGLGDLLILDISMNKLRVLEDGRFRDLHRLRELQLQYNKISELKPGAFSGLQSLKKLKLHFNELPVIKNETFKSLGGLTHLDLSHNKLTAIQVRAFSGLNKLEELDLRNNSLTRLQNRVFSDLINVGTVYLFDNKIKTVEVDAFFGLGKVHSLNLRNNTIENLEDGTFKPLKNLMTLFLSFNKLTKIGSGVLNGPQMLSELHLNSNNFKELKNKTFENVATLEYLDLNDNSISQIESQVFFGLLGMVQLNFNNKLKEMTPETLEQLIKALVHPVSIMTMSLSDNKIKALPDQTFKSLTMLGTLNLTHNDLETISPNAFGAPGKIIKLMLSGNKFKSVMSNTFKDFTGLTDLYLDLNKIEFCQTDAFKGANRLNTLYLDNNVIKEINNSDIWTGLGSLKTLRLNNNQINALQDKTFIKLKSVEKLRLDFNRIATISTLAFEGLNKLANLSLSNNKIESIDGEVFRQITGLKHLDLSHNLIKNVGEQTFTPLGSIQALLLLDNRIESFQPNALAHMSALDKVHLENNSLASVPQLTLTENRQIKLYLTGNGITSLPLNTNKQFVYIEYEKEEASCSCGQLNKLFNTYESHFFPVKCLNTGMTLQWYDFPWENQLCFAPKINYIEAKLDGSDERLLCVAGGSPKPNITWYDTYPVQDSLPIMGDGDAPINPIPVDSSLPEARYTCTASNDYGSVNLTFTLRGQPGMVSPGNNSVVIGLAVGLAVALFLLIILIIVLLCLRQSKVGGWSIWNKQAPDQVNFSRS